jgi:hypothetical protein
MDGNMIELLSDLYPYFMWSLSVGFLVAAFIVWFCIYMDMKEKQKFDDKYRKSRNLKNNEWDL